MLAKYWRIRAVNSTGQTIAANGIVVTSIGWNFTPSGAVQYAASPTPAVIDNSGTVANAASEVSAAQDNSADKYIGTLLQMTVIFPASAAGDVTLYLEQSNDNSVWDTETIPILTLAGSSSVTKTATVQL